MKKWMLSGVFAAGFVFAAVAENAAPAPAAAPAATEHGPKIVCDKPDFDFGGADGSATIEHVYEIKNAGDLSLTLKEVKASCGCTVVKTSTMNLAPGDTAQITATLNLHGRSGHQDKHVMVSSDDPKTPMLLLNLRGDVVQEYAITPDRITIGQVRGDQSTKTQVTFVNNTSNEVHVTKVDSTAPYLKPTVTETVAGKSYRVDVEVSPPLPAGSIDAVIHIFTDNATRPVFDVPFNASVMGAVVVAPPQILLSGTTTDAVTRFVIIRPGTISNVKVLSAEAPDPRMKTHIQPFATTGFRVQIDGIVASSNLIGKAIKITTDAESMKEISVPFQVLPAPNH